MRLDAMNDTALMQIRKLQYRFLKPRGQWHNRKYHPSFKVEADAAGTWKAYYKGAMVCEGRPIGGLRMPDTTVCVIASGPSIKEITDMRRFGRLSCACVNGSYALAEKYGLVPDYYVVCDPVFIECQEELFMRAIRGSRRFMTQHHLIHRAAEMGLDLSQANEIYLYDDLRRPFGRVKHAAKHYRSDPDRFIVHETKNMAFSMAPEIGIFSSSTVVYNAVQLLFGCGAEHLYIFGMDLTDQKRFYEARDRTAPTHLEASYEERTLPSFELVSEYVRTRGKEIWNCSPHSRLPANILPKMDPNQALNQLTASPPPPTADH